MKSSPPLSASHDASASLTGYLYQARYALLRGLVEGRRYPGHALSIEKFDDVAFEAAGLPVELIQTKHHGNRGDVSDASVDLWKTLHIWIRRIIEDPASAANTRLVFLTTSAASDGSALSMLRQVGGGRDESRAVELLHSAANDSRNQATAAARDAFLGLTDAARQSLIGNTWVFDKAPDIIDVRDKIEMMLHYSATPDQVGDLTDHLEGWWFNRVIMALMDPIFAEIPLAAIQNKVSDLRENFRLGNLPLDEKIETMLAGKDLPRDNRTFIRQMNFVNVPDNELRATVHDYYRAYEQRSRWARENLFLDSEADRYDRGLYDAWQRRFFACTAEVTEGCDDAIRRAQGRKVFRWAREYQKPLRNRDELWLSSGSFQMLADEAKVGWHPDYETLLESLKGET